ncbi:MAG: hypothetical protein ABI895_42195 [Deltaproteobacteria bacterium]
MVFRLPPPEQAEFLAAAVSDTTPLLLELARAQARRKRPKDLLSQYIRDAYVSPLFLDQRLVHRLDSLALTAATSYEALHLSPVAPLGSCSVIALTSQHRTLSTTRGTEVVSDPTNVFALECAKRLMVAPEQPVRLCTVHQVLRAQPFRQAPGHSRHFRMFALAEAGPARAEDGFELDAMASQLAVLDRLFDALTTQLGCSFPRRRALVRAAPASEALGARAAKCVIDTLPHVDVSREPLDAPYYDGLRIMFGAESTAGEWIPIADLGRFDWVARLTSNRRYRFIASGCGLQLAPVAFRPEGVVK